MPKYYSLDDFEAEARKRLPKMIFEFVAGAAETGASLRENRYAFDEFGLIPRVLTDVSTREQSTQLLGQVYSSPIGISPMGSAALCAYRGDLALGRAAAAANVPMIVSAASLIRLEDIKRECPTAWYQAYVAGDNSSIKNLLDRVGAAGYDTLVITADVPVQANRENNLRSGYQLPLKITPYLVWEALTHPSWLIGTWMKTLFRHGIPHLENMDATRGSAVLSREVVRRIGGRDKLNWRNIEYIRGIWKGKLVIKGIVSPQDARIARLAGADGLILSNHGGRQLDGAISPLRTLPEIAADSHGIGIMIDGGIRRGTDVLKALALGAHFCFVGRPMLYAAAAGGESGVLRALELLAAEIDRDMALLGTSHLSEIDMDHVRALRSLTSELKRRN